MDFTHDLTVNGEHDGETSSSTWCTSDQHHVLVIRSPTDGRKSRSQPLGCPAGLLKRFSNSMRQAVDQRLQPTSLLQLSSLPTCHCQQRARSLISVSFARACTCSMRPCAGRRVPRRPPTPLASYRALSSTCLPRCPRASGASTSTHAPGRARACHGSLPSPLRPSHRLLSLPLPSRPLPCPLPPSQPPPSWPPLPTHDEVTPPPPAPLLRLFRRLPSPLRLSRPLPSQRRHASRRR